MQEEMKTRYFRIRVRLEYRITSLAGKLFPYASDEVFPVFLLVKQTPSELILVALTQLGFKGEEFMDQVINTLEETFAMVLRCHFEASNVIIEEINQTHFLKALLTFASFVDAEYFQEEL